MYAHRNEDIVNMGSRLPVNEKPNARSEEDEKQTCLPAEERKESDEVEVRENSQVPDSSKKRKRGDSSLLALLMGMEEAELDKILFSQPPT